MHDLVSGLDKPDKRLHVNVASKRALALNWTEMRNLPLSIPSRGMR